MIPTPSEAPSGTPRERLPAVLWALLLFAATLALHTRHNDFPYFYHPDESAKAEQVITGRWNFHHPMLLLTATKAAVVASGVKPGEQTVVEAGRWVSAGCMAAAVVAFSLVAWAWRGWTAAFATGLALMLHHQLFELAHYLKEDSALLLGVGWTFLAAFLFWRKPDAWRAALLGAAVGAAVSGKYVGVCMLAVALPVLWCAPGGRRRRVASFGAALVVVLAVVNLPLLLNLDPFEKSLERETRLVMHGHGGLRRNVPHTQYWNIFRDNSTPAVWGLLLVFLASRWRERRALSLPEWMVMAFPFAFALVLSFSSKSNDRYFLPATAAFTLLAAMGAVDAARWLARRMSLRWALTGAALSLVAPQVPGWMRYDAAFQNDDHAALLAWIKAELPPDAVISKDSRIELPDPNEPRDAGRFAPMPQKILAARFAADNGTMSEQRGKGVTHLAVSESDYGRFFLRGLRPQPGEEEKTSRRKAFYEELLRDGGDPLFRRDRGVVLYLHPGIRVYRMPPDAD